MAGSQSQSEAESDEQGEWTLATRSSTRSPTTSRFFEIGPKYGGHSEREERRAVQTAVERPGQHSEGLGYHRTVQRHGDHLRLFQTDRLVDREKRDRGGQEETRSGGCCTAASSRGAEGVEERRKGVQYSSARQ